MNAQKLFLIAMLSMLAIACGGCGGARFLAYVLSPENQDQTVEAEYTGLDNHTVAIVVFADPGVQFYYPYVRQELSMMIAAQMQKNLKQVRIYDPARVIGYQNDTLDWEAQDKTALGKLFGVDYVMYVSLTTFETKEMGMEYLYRGNIEADVAIYDTHKNERESKTWSADGLRASYPEQATPAENDLAIRATAEAKFADQLVKKFYKHKVPPNEK